MATIKVDPAFLRSMERQLRGVKDALERLDDDTERYTPETVTGDDRVGVQLRQFGGNWVDSRVGMAERMEELATQLYLAADAYVRTDGGLGQQYERAPRGG
jgi:hypothetical protein